MEQILITEKGLECHRCHSLFKEHKKPPICKTKRGCPVEADAKNTLLNVRVNAFRRYKTLQQIDAPQALREKELARACLSDDVDGLLLVETIHAKAQNLKIEAQRIKQKHHGR